MMRLTRKALFASIFSLLFFSFRLMAGDDLKISTEDYISTFKQLAISEMHKSGIPASITLAQAILESGSGNSRLAREGNNHFGIKCHKEWTGPSIIEDDDLKNECFRKYPSAEDSYLDHSQFLMTRDRYAGLFKLHKTDYKGWANGLKEAGYATNPRYATILITLVERYELQLYDYVSPGSNLAEVKPHKKEETPTVGISAVKASELFYVNRVKAVTLQAGETLDDVAKRFYLRANTLRTYNEIISDTDIYAGATIYIQPKRSRAQEKYHIVKEGETFYSISQRYGIKISYLYKRNLVDPPAEPAVGERVYMRSNRDKPIKTRKATPAKQKEGTTSKADKPIVKQEKVATVKTAEKQPEILEPKVEKHENNIIEEPKEEPKYIYQPNDEIADEEEVVVPESGEIPVIVDSKKVETTLDTKPVELDYIYHTIEKGNTLFSIARQYEVPVDQIRTWNKMESDTIRIGERIVVGVK